MILEGMYLNAETAKEGELIRFETEGEESKIERGKDQKTVINFYVTRMSDNKSLIYTPSWKAIKVFKEAWGNDTKNWINKIFKVKYVLMEVAGNEMHVIRPQPFIKEESVK